MKNLLAGIVLLVVLGIGGFLYRSQVENRPQMLACPADARLCPDGTALGRIGPSCSFPACPPPNVRIADIGMEFALPAGYVPSTYTDGDAVVAAYEHPPTASSTELSQIVIRKFAIVGTTTPIEVIRATAIQDGSGMPAPATAFSSVTIGTRRFTVVTIGRFEGIIQTAYYLARGTDVLRFDAIDRGVNDWTDPNLKVADLPAHTDIRAFLATLQGN